MKYFCEASPQFTPVNLLFRKQFLIIQKYEEKNVKTTK